MTDRTPITIAVKCPTCGNAEPKLLVGHVDPERRPFGRDPRYVRKAA